MMKTAIYASIFKTSFAITNKNLTRLKSDNELQSLTHQNFPSLKKKAAKANLLSSFYHHNRGSKLKLLDLYQSLAGLVLIWYIPVYRHMIHRPRRKRRERRGEEEKKSRPGGHGRGGRGVEEEEGEEKKHWTDGQAGSTR